MRDTNYATELARGTVSFPDNSEGRIERLMNKKRRQEEIRFSWWKDNKMIPRPLDATEEELFTLLKDGICNNVFSNTFRRRLKDIL